MSEKKIIAVLGATGAQGGGVANSILNDPSSEFTVRAITRNPDSDKAKNLVHAGAEVVAAELDDQASLKKAFSGAYGVYGATNFWEHLSPEKETKQAKNIAHAAKEAGVKHVIWSSFEDTRDLVPLTDDRMPTLMGNYKVPHFDSKAEANNTFTELGVPTTFMFTSFYWDNFIYFGMGPKPGEDGSLSIALPMGDKKLPGIAASDIGKCAYGIFKAGNKYVNKTVGVASEHLTGNETAKAFTTSLGKRVTYNAIPPDMYRSFGFPGAEDLGNMFQYIHDFNEAFCGLRNANICKELNPSLQSFDEWLAVNKDRIPLE